MESTATIIFLGFGQLHEVSMQSKLHPKDDLHATRYPIDKLPFLFWLVMFSLVQTKNSSLSMYV